MMQMQVTAMQRQQMQSQYMMQQVRSAQTPAASDKFSEKLDTVMMQNAQLLKKLDDGELGPIRRERVKEGIERDAPMHETLHRAKVNTPPQQETSIPNDNHKARLERRAGFLDPASQKL